MALLSPSSSARTCFGNVSVHERTRAMLLLITGPVCLVVAQFEYDHRRSDCQISNIGAPCTMPKRMIRGYILDAITWLTPSPKKRKKERTDNENGNSPRDDDSSIAERKFHTVTKSEVRSRERHSYQRAKPKTWSPSYRVPCEFQFYLVTRLYFNEHREIYTRRRNVPSNCSN